MKEAQTVNLNILVALGCEAKPLIKQWGLQKSCDQPFRLYEGKVESGSKKGTDRVAQIHIRLLISGSGLQRMSMAVGWLAAQTNKSCLWLNIGTAGHPTLEIGELRLLESITDPIEKRVYYPVLLAKTLAKPSIATVALQSVLTPTQDYPADCAVDMEASAFFASASQFASLENIQCLKVVSDNATTDIADLTAKKISALMQAQGAQITDYIGRFAATLCSTGAVETELALDQLHATVSQKRQYQELLRRARSLALDDLPEVSRFARMSELLRATQEVVDATVPSLLSGHQNEVD